MARRRKGPRSFAGRRPPALLALAPALALIAAGCGNGGGDPATGPVAAPAPEEVVVPPDPGEEQVLLLRNAQSPFDPFIDDPGPGLRDFIGAAYWRMRGFPPAFDKALAYAPPTHAALGVYPIYTEPRTDGLADPGTLEEHPDWVLRDKAGEPLYIPFDCDGNRCTQYAADFGNPEWRQFIIDVAREHLERGYAGLHLDDVNMEWRVSDAAGNFTQPVDPRTGELMTLEAWRRYMTRFVEEIRAAFPEAEISHNPLWFADRTDPLVKRQLKAADFVELERGYSDEGLRTGAGTYGFETFLEHIDFVHSLGRPIILEPYDLDREGAEYELAGYMLTRELEDSVAPAWRADPGDLWEGWQLDLGPAKGGRYAWEGAWRRDFRDGFVVLAPPGSPGVSAKAPHGFTTIEGEPVERIELTERQGAVLVAR